VHAQEHFKSIFYHVFDNRFFIDSSDPLNSFYCCLFHGVIETFQAIPIYAISVRTVGAMIIETIQIGSVTAIIPPSSEAQSSTIFIIFIVMISIFRCELHSILIV
jgi:hypothetical protein